MFLEVRIRQRGFVKLPTIIIIENISRTMTSARRSRFDKITFYNCDIILTTYFNIFSVVKLYFLCLLTLTTTRKKPKNLRISHRRTRFTVRWHIIRTYF